MPSFLHGIAIPFGGVVAALVLMRLALVRLLTWSLAHPAQVKALAQASLGVLTVSSTGSTAAPTDPSIPKAS
jgi:hypothetical protein